MTLLDKSQCHQGQLLVILYHHWLAIEWSHHLLQWGCEGLLENVEKCRRCSPFCECTNISHETRITISWVTGFLVPFFSHVNRCYMSNVDHRGQPLQLKITLPRTSILVHFLRAPLVGFLPPHFFHFERGKIISLLSQSQWQQEVRETVHHSFEEDHKPLAWESVRHWQLR
jgi:hypothetical protein